MLVYNEKNTERYLGGAAVANNISDFTNNITLLSYLGEKKTNLDQFVFNLKKILNLNLLEKQLCNN